jgi:hypothetical protein
LNIDGDGDMDVLNDTDIQPDSPEEIEPPGYGGYGEIYEEPQRAYAKSVKPSFLDEIRGYNAKRQPQAAGVKPSEIDI